MKTRGELRERLDILIRLNAISLIRGRTQSDQVRLLTIAGMGPTEISKIIGTTPNTVNVYLSALRSKNGLTLKERKEDDD